MTTQPQVQTLTELKLNEAIRDFINNSYLRGHPILVAYVDGDKPSLSYRGSAVVYSDDEVAVWARTAEGGILKGVTNNPNVALVYREGDPPPARSRVILNMKGQGRVDRSEAARKWVYDNMPQIERDSDKDFNGFPVIIKLTSLTGTMPGFRLQMAR